MTVDQLWDNLKPLVKKVDNIERKVDNLSVDVKEIKNEVHKNNINITAILTGQENIRKELARKTEENNVEHKKFEYQIANLEWKSKIAN